MKRRIVVLAALMGLLVGTAGCVIKNAEGQDLLRVQLGDDKDKKNDTPKEPEAEPTPAPEDVADDTAEAPREPEKPAAAETGSEGPAEDFTLVPWWAKKNVKVRDIEEKAPASEFETVEESKTDEARAEEPAEDSTSEEEAGEALGEAQTEVAALTPVKRTVAVDRSLQPVSAATWDTAYKQNTSKSSSPSRRASMDQVQKAVEGGYGAAYVARLEKAISVDRNNGYAYYFLARGRFDDGDWKGAANFADKAVQKLTDDVGFRSSARVLLAKALGNVGETQDAAIQVEAALVDNPNNTEARIMMLRYQ